LAAEYIYFQMMRYRRLHLAGATWFFTVVTYRRRPLLCQAEVLAILRSVLQEERHRRPFRIPAIVVLPDHLHCLWTLPEDDSDFPLRWRRIKGETARRVAILQGDCRPLWQARYREHMIRDDADFGRHVDYIHFNAVKHGLSAIRPTGRVRASPAGSRAGRIRPIGARPRPISRPTSDASRSARLSGKDPISGNALAPGRSVGLAALAPTDHPSTPWTRPRLVRA
jgi:putative transposase